MNIDERGARAATDLLERASHRAVPSASDLIARRPRRRLALLVGAAAAVLVLAGVAFTATRRDDAVRVVTSLPTPAGVQARQWSPKGLGVTMAVPDTWGEGGPTAGFRYSIAESNRDSYVLADRVRNVQGLDTDAVGSSRAADLQAFGATGITTSAVQIGGRRVVELRYRLQSAGAVHAAAITEYDIAAGDWFFLVAVSENEPVTQTEITRWIGSSITLRPLNADDLTFTDPLAQPIAALPAPSGVTAKPWTPDGLGATLQVPSTWADMTSIPAGYQHAIQPPGGGPTVMVDRVTSDAAAQRDTYLRGAGAVIESTADTTVDGHPTRATRYWIARGGPLHVFIDVEYVIDVGDGHALIITTSENDGGDDYSQLLLWIRSTITIQ